MSMSWIGFAHKFWFEAWVTTSVMCAFLKPKRMRSLGSFKCLYISMIWEMRYECEYEVEEDAIEVQSDEEVDTECTEKE